MEYINYNIKNKNGMFYTTSKEEKEGYVLNKYTNRETNKEETNYHKDVSTLKGSLMRFGVKSSPFGERFFIHLKQEDGNVAAMEINVFRSGTSINDYIKSFAQYLDQFKTDDVLEIYLNKKNKDSNGYLYKNVYISANGENLKWSFPIYGEESPVPQPSKVINKVTKKETWDYSDVDAFFYERVKGEVKTEEASTQKEVETVMTQKEDDLPF